jgi:hypothetical protein
MKRIITVDLKNVHSEWSLFQALYSPTEVPKKKLPPLDPLKYPVAKEHHYKSYRRWYNLHWNLKNLDIPEFVEGDEVHLILKNWDVLEEKCDSIPFKYKWDRKLKIMLADLTNKEMRRDGFGFSFEIVN